MSNHTGPENTDSSAGNVPDFEAALTELESIIVQMESGQLPLQQSLAAYKRGAELLGLCQKSLAQVEQQIRILNESNQLQPFTPIDD